MTETTTTANTNVNHAGEIQGPPLSTERRRSSISRIVDAIKKPFSSSKQGKNKEEVPPALQDAINILEDRKQSTIQEMESQGKDVKVLSGKRFDNVRNPLRG